MMNKMQTVPVYSTSYNDSTPRDETLDVLTYDRAVGDLYSSAPEDVKELLAEQLNEDE